jgi:Copper amine oxidase, enzyme domain
MTDARSSRRKAESGIRVTVKPFGPSTEALAAIGARVMALAGVRKLLGRSKGRLLYVEALDAEVSEEKRGRPSPPNRFRATIQDDIGHRTLLVEGRLNDPAHAAVAESALPPHPSDAEFAAAVKLVRRDPALAESIAAGRLEPYQPIPPLHLTVLPDGRVERCIAVGLLPRGVGALHEVVSVDTARRRVYRFDDRVLPEAHPHAAGLCGVPHDASQATAGKGTAGQAWVTITQGGQTLWRFLAVRPAASSGTNGSGIELRYVDFKGKRVLYRAHVPILNVKYDADACGPYRDWQYQEGMILAQGADVAPGFRLCPTPAQTIMDTGSDSGNFLGVGIFVQGSEVVFVSELEAGWYRYISQWRMHTNGTLRPRFGFAAVESECVCNVHHHHVYWRLDFDIRSAGNNRVREFNDPPLVGTGNWHTKSFEIRRPREFARKRKWRIENTRSGEAYEVVPRIEDGIASTQPDWPFGRGDVWILRYRGSEVDDSVLAIGPPYEAGIDRWVNGEPVSDHDVVLWYGAHFTHDVNHDGAAQHGHVVGPDLKPVRW